MTTTVSAKADGRGCQSSEAARSEVDGPAFHHPTEIDPHVRGSRDRAARDVEDDVEETARPRLHTSRGSVECGGRERAIVAERDERRADRGVEDPVGAFDVRTRTHEDIEELRRSGERALRAVQRGELARR